MQPGKKVGSVVCKGITHRPAHKVVQFRVRLCALGHGLCFDMGSRCVAWTGTNSEPSSCLSHPDAGMTGCAIRINFSDI